MNNRIDVNIASAKLLCNNEIKCNSYSSDLNCPFIGISKNYISWSILKSLALFGSVMLTSLWKSSRWQVQSFISGHAGKNIRFESREKVRSQRMNTFPMNFSMIKLNYVFRSKFYWQLFEWLVLIPLKKLYIN